MRHKSRRAILNRLLLQAHTNKRLWPALLALLFGTCMLLYAVVLWTGFKELMGGHNSKTDVYGAYLTISKAIPASEEIHKQKPKLFTNKEIRALGSLPGVDDIGMFSRGNFPVEVAFEGGDELFSTNLFLESVPERFIDNKPPDWYWQPSSGEVPVIVSNEFLNLYNFGYAPNQGVPQLTSGTIKALSFSFTIGKGDFTEVFTARVVGFSDRISSILVPESFIAYGNEYYAVQKPGQPMRLIIRVQDPSDELLVNYLKGRDYVTNNELLRLNKLRTVLYAAMGGMALLAIILLVMGVTVFSLFVQLTLTRAAQNLQLLTQLGYSPRFLARFVWIRYVLILIAVVVVAAVAIVMAQVRTAKAILDVNLYIATFPGWQVWATLGVVFVSLVIAVRFAVNKGLK